MASPAAASTAALCSCSNVGDRRSRTGCRRLWGVSNSHPLSVLPHFLSSRCLPYRPPHHHQRRQHLKSRLPSVATGTVALRFSRIRAAASPASPLHHPGDFGDGGGGTRSSGLLDRLRAGIAFIGSVLPGGRWWELEEIIGERKEERVGAMQKGLPTSFALGKMWKLVANERWIIYAGFTSLLLAAFSDISIPHFLAASIFSAQSGDAVLFYRNVRILVLLCFASGICSGLRSCFFGLANLILVKRMREIVFSALLFQDMSFFDEKTVGNLSSRLGADCQQVSQVIGNDLNLISRNVLQGSGALIYLFILSWPLALSTLAICFVLAIIMIFHGHCIDLLPSPIKKRKWKKETERSHKKHAEQRMGSLHPHGDREVKPCFVVIQKLVYSEKHIIHIISPGISITTSTSPIPLDRYQKKAAKSTQDVTASANEVAQEVLSLIRTVRVFGTEKQESKRYIRRLNILADICLRQSVAHGFWNLIFNFLYHSTQVVAVLIGGASMMAGYFSAEKLTKFILYSEWLIYATWRMADNWSSLMQSIGASEEVFKLMDLLPSKEFLTAGMKLKKLTGRVEFVNVSFYYPSRKTVPVLQNINLTVFPNEVVAIVGLSGSGKSTLVNLLLNLYQPTSGQILIDGFLVEDLDIKCLRERIGYVGQEPRLFRMDVRSNIRYGCTRKTNHEDVELAAKQAFVHWFILSLPYGYETLVDDDLLSGGQKQRIAIARAILRDPDILILDEATSALDAESEYYVKGLLHDVQSGSKTKRTIIVIAHRLSTIKSADRIIVMDNGRIVEMGNHSELLRNNGIYARLTERQTDTLA